jgi:hypothetical protein
MHAATLSPEPHSASIVHFVVSFPASRRSSSALGDGAAEGIGTVGVGSSSTGNGSESRMLVAHATMRERPTEPAHASTSARLFLREASIVRALRRNQRATHMPLLDRSLTRRLLSIVCLSNAPIRIDSRSALHRFAEMSRALSSALRAGRSSWCSASRVKDCR